MNILAFEKKEDYIEALHDKSYVIEDFPVPLNDTLKKHLYHEWNPDFPYAIIQYYIEEEDQDIFDIKFNGKKLVVSENSESPHLWPNLIDVADIYIRHNTQIASNIPSLRYGMYYPHLKTCYYNVREMLQPNKKLDIMFSGVIRLGRRFILEKLDKACRNLNLSYKIVGKSGRGYYYSREKYIEMVCKTKLLVTLQGKGSRQWREWHAMYGGCMLLYNPGLRGFPFVVMQPGINFEFMDLENLEKQIEGLLKTDLWKEYAARNMVLGHECFMKAPTIDVRLAAVHLFGDYPQLWTLQDIEKAEGELF